MNKKIGQLQIISLGVCYLMGTIMRSVFITMVVTNDSWIIALTGALFFMPTALVYITLTRRYPGKGLFEINEQVFGSVAGRVVSFIYLIYFLSICALNAQEADSFLSNFVMEGTSEAAIMIVFMAACVYCVKKGIVALARMSTAFGIFCLALILFNITMSLGRAHFNFIFPVLNHPLLHYVQASHVAAAIPYGESIFLLALLQKASSELNFKKAYLWILAITIFIILIVQLREVITLGPLLGFLTLPSYESTRLISISYLVARTESIYSLLLTTLCFFKVVVSFYVSCDLIVRIFKLESYRHICIILAALLVPYSLRVLPKPGNNIYWGTNIAPFVWSAFTFGLPLITLAASLISKPLRARSEVIKT